MKNIIMAIAALSYSLTSLAQLTVKPKEESGSIGILRYNKETISLSYSTSGSSTTYNLHYYDKRDGGFSSYSNSIIFKGKDTFNKLYNLLNNLFTSKDGSVAITLGKDDINIFRETDNGTIKLLFSSYKFSFHLTKRELDILFNK